MNAVEERVLVFAPTDNDAALVRNLFDGAEVDPQHCEDVGCLCEELEAGAAAVLIPEEAIDIDRVECLAAFLSRQPSWSDLPLLVIARAGADSVEVAEALDRLGNVIVLERPLTAISLQSAVRAALRARRRQYQMREQLAARDRSERVLRSAERRKAEFLAILAHELRNPLAPIKNSLHILELTGGADPTTRRASAMMERQVSLMVRLVDDLLEISRITRGNVVLRKVEVDLARVVHDAVESSRPLVDAGGHTLSVSVPGGEMLIDGDEVRLAQVFSNLLDNAAKYTDPGGRIDVVAVRQDDEAIISVRDSGTGIPEDMLPRVFDMFTQVDAAAHRAHGGLGIGLTLVRSLVEMHGGTIEAHSEGRGKGSEFIVRLPVQPEASAPHRSVAATAQDPARAPSHRVLVVDDNRDAAESLGMLLRLLGADVHVAQSGRDALRILGAFRAEMVLLDIGMPGMDGYEVARRIRAIPEFRDVLLVALTGWGQDEDRRRSRQAGFDHHLVKPADVTMLQRLLGAGETGEARDASARRV